MAKPLYDLIEKYVLANPVRFHMPSHNGVEMGGLSRGAGWDITELSFSDNLHRPVGVIKEAEDLLANAYGTGRSLMLTTGATSAVFIALASVGEKTVALLGDAHKSFFNACDFLAIKIEKIDNISEIDSISAKVVFATSPNYFGETIDLKTISDKTKSLDKILIVDGAHGSHFAFSKLLPQRASDFADLTIESFHKTLPVFTGGAGLNIARAELVPLAEFYRQKLTSTSPSYPIMASIDFARELMERDGENLYQKVFSEISRQTLRLEQGGFRVLKNDDRTRICVQLPNARDVAQELERSNIFVEMVTDDRLVLIVTPFNADKLPAFADFLLAMPNNYIDLKKKSNYIDLKKKSNYIDLKKTSSQLSVDKDSSERELREDKVKENRAIEFLSLEKIEGKTLATEVGIYPPGVPIAFCGDVVDREMIKVFRENYDRLFGLVADKFAVWEDDNGTR